MNDLDPRGIMGRELLDLASVYIARHALAPGQVWTLRLTAAEGFALSVSDWTRVQQEVDARSFALTRAQVDGAPPELVPLVILHRCEGSSCTEVHASLYLSHVTFSDRPTTEAHP